MRTTVSINDELLARAKLVAARTHTTLGSVLEDALRKLLDERPARPGERLTLPDFGYAGGLLPGVDLDDRDAMRELMGDEGSNALL